HPQAAGAPPAGGPRKGVAALAPAQGAKWARPALPVPGRRPAGHPVPGSPRAPLGRRRQHSPPQLPPLLPGAPPAAAPRERTLPQTPRAQLTAGVTTYADPAFGKNDGHPVLGPGPVAVPTPAEPD